MDMEEIKIFEIQIVTKRLLRHRYTMGEISVVANRELPAEYHEGSGILMDNIRLREEQEMLMAEVHVHALQENASSNSEKDSADHAEHVSAESPSRGKKRFRKLKKPNLSLFEEVIDENLIIEEAIDKKINQDHYYDVITPFDADNQIAIQSQKKNNGIIIFSLLAVLGILTAALIWLIGRLLS